MKMQGPDLLRICSEGVPNYDLYHDLKIDKFLERYFPSLGHGRGCQTVGIEDLVVDAPSGSTPFGTSRQWHVLFDLPQDMEAILYRQSIIRDLTNFPSVFTTLWKAKYSFRTHVVEEEYRPRGNRSVPVPENLPVVIGALDATVECLSTMQSEGLQSLRNFYIELRDQVKEHATRAENVMRGAGNTLAVIDYDFADRDGRGITFVGAIPAEAVPDIAKAARQGSLRIVIDDEQIEVLPTIPERSCRIGGFSRMNKIADDIMVNALLPIDRIMRNAAEPLEQLGFYFDAYRFSAAMTAARIPMTLPVIKSKEEQTISVTQTVHPAMPLYDSRVKLEKIVPNDIKISGERLQLITGLNAGGKSWYLRTIGLMQTLAQAGIYVPAEKATVSMADRIYFTTSRGDEEGGKSKLQNQILRAEEVFSTATPYSILLIDEPFTGTSHADIKMLLSQEIELAAALTARCAVATHLHEVAAEMQGSSYVKNMKVAYTAGSDPRPMYSIVPGRGMISGGYQEAERLGFSKAAILEQLGRRARKERFALRKIK